MSTTHLTPSPQVQTDWQNQVQELIKAARQYPQDSHRRNRYLTQVIRIVAPKLWKFYTPYYADALQQTWLYFAKHVCTQYDPTRASIVTWLNTYLRYRHQDLVTQAMTRQQRELAIDTDRENEGRGVRIMEIPSRGYGSLSLLEEVTEWVEADADGTLQQTHLKGRPDLNCQTLILLRLPPETPWKEIAARFDVPIPTLSSFYRRHCLPALRQLAESVKLCA